MYVIFCLVACTLSIYCCKPHPLITEIVESDQKAESAVIFLHGTGESGPMMREIVESHIGSLSQFPKIRFIFPTSKTIKFAPLPWNGQLTTSWIDAEENKVDCELNYDFMDDSANMIEKWVEDQVKSGVPRERICVVGYSNGGAMSMIYGYEYANKIGCVGAIAAFLPKKTYFYMNVSSGESEIKRELPPLYITAGGLDFLVYPSWVKETAEFYKSIGVPVTFNHQPIKTHLINTEALEGLFKFILQTITPTHNSLGNEE